MKDLLTKKAHFHVYLHCCTMHSGTGTYVSITVLATYPDLRSRNGDDE
jgi:hypothetical protein